MFVLRWWMLASTLGCCVGYKIVKKPAEYYDYHKNSKGYQSQPSKYQWQPLEYKWQPIEYQEQRYDYQTYDHQPYDYQSYAYQPYDYQPQHYQSYDYQSYNYQPYHYQSYEYQPYEYPSYEYQPYDYPAHYYQPYAYQHYAYQPNEHQPNYASNYYYYDPHHEPSVSHSYDTKPKLPSIESDQLLRVYRLIRVIEVLRNPVHKTATSLDMLVRELTDEGLKLKLVELLLPSVYGHEVAALMKDLSLKVKNAFVNDHRQLLVAIQRVLNGLSLPTECHDDLCKRLRGLRDQANALTVQQIEAELHRPSKGHAKDPVISVVQKNEPIKAESKNTNEVDENYEVVGLDVRNPNLVVVDGPKGKLQKESKEQPGIDNEDVKNKLNELGGKVALYIETPKIMQDHLDKQENSIEERKEPETTTTPTYTTPDDRPMPVTVEAKQPSGVGLPTEDKDDENPNAEDQQENSIEQIVVPDTTVASTTTPASTTTDVPLMPVIVEEKQPAWSGLLLPGHYGSSNEVPDTQTLPDQIDVSKPTILVEPEDTETSTPQTQNVWVHEETLTKNPLDFAIDQRFQTAEKTTMVTPFVPEWSIERNVIEDRKGDDALHPENKHTERKETTTDLVSGEKVEEEGPIHVDISVDYYNQPEIYSTPEPVSLDKQQELEPLETTTVASTTSDDQLTTVNIQEAHTESGPVESRVESSTETQTGLTPIASTPKPESRDEQQELQPLDTTTEASTTPVPTFHLLTTINPVEPNKDEAYITQLDMSEPYARRRVLEKILHLLVLLEEAAGFPELRVYVTKQDVNQLLQEMTWLEGGVKFTDLLTGMQKLIETKEMINGDRIVDLLEFWKQYFEGRVDDGYFEKTYGLNKTAENRQNPEENDELTMELMQLGNWQTGVMESKDLGADDYAEGVTRRNNKVATQLLSFDGSEFQNATHTLFQNETALEAGNSSTSELPVESRNARIYKVDDSQNELEHSTVVDETTVPVSPQAEQVTDKQQVATPQSFPTKAT